jgi:hypothetical protein
MYRPMSDLRRPSSPSGAPGTEIALLLSSLSRELVVLRITLFDGSDLTRTLKLQGKLLRPWIDELASACGTAQVSPDRIRLDLIGVTFMDVEGAQFLERLIRDGARVVACSAFAAEMLQLEGY